MGGCWEGPELDGEGWECHLSRRTPSTRLWPVIPRFFSWITLVINASSLPCEIPWDNIPGVPKCHSRTREFVTIPPFALPSLFQDRKELLPLLLSQIQASRPWNERWDLSPVALVLWDYSRGNNSQLRTESRNSGRRIPTPAAASREGTGRSRKMG